MAPHEYVILEVARERERQIGKGYNAHHDAQHEDGVIAFAAAALAVLGDPDEELGEGNQWQSLSISNLLWPDSWGEIRDEGRRSNLVRAASLIVAEIERLDGRAVEERVTSPTPSTTSDPQGLYAVVKPFAAYADPRKQVPADYVITPGSPLAKRQLTMGDCYAAADAIAGLEAAS